MTTLIEIFPGLARPEFWYVLAAAVAGLAVIAAGTYLERNRE